MNLALPGPEPILRHATQARLRACSLAGLLLLSSAALFAGQAPETKSSPADRPPAPAKTSRKAHSAKHRSSQGKSRGKRSRERRQLAPTPQRISEVQSALARAGQYSGELTGKWDASTVEAMKKFQEANGLQPTGKLDARALQKLGLGSPVAGAGAPRPTAGPVDASSPKPLPPRLNPLR
jgi:peptidoglycan hydrolase-like protein with peptidoglycan-binding domain